MTASVQTDQLRLFVAVTLPPEVRETIAKAIGRLRDADLRGVRLVAPEGVHVTLKFLGNVDAALVPSLTDALTAAVPAVVPFELALRGAGAFPNDRAPRVLWAGLAGDTDALAGLARRVDEVYAPLGFPRERPPFRPHLTIARLRDSATPADRLRAAHAIASIRPDLGGVFTVDALHLVSSQLTPTGARYETLHLAPLRTVQT